MDTKYLSDALLVWFGFGGFFGFVLFFKEMTYLYCLINLHNFPVFCKNIFYSPCTPFFLILNKRHLSFSAMLPYLPNPSIFQTKGSM